MCPEIQNLTVFRVVPVTPGHDPLRLHKTVVTAPGEYWARKLLEKTCRLGSGWGADYFVRPIGTAPFQGTEEEWSDAVCSGVLPGVENWITKDSAPIPHFTDSNREIKINIVTALSATGMGVFSVFLATKSAHQLGLDMALVFSFPVGFAAMLLTTIILPCVYHFFEKRKLQN